MIRTLSARRVMFAVVAFAFVPVLAACPKKHEPAVADAEPPPPAVDAAPAALVPTEDDAGADVDAADAAKPHATGPYKPADPIVSRIKQCCTALTAQAKANGNPPEIMQAVNTCNMVAGQLSANPNAPELNAFRPMLKMMRNLPSPCAGL